MDNISAFRVAYLDYAVGRCFVLVSERAGLGLAGKYSSLLVDCKLVRGFRGTR